MYTTIMNCVPKLVWNFCQAIQLRHINKVSWLSIHPSIHPSVRPFIHPSIFQRTRFWRINTIQLILPCRDIIIDQSFKSVNPPNRPWFPSYPGPLYQNEVKCSAFDIEMICYSLEIKRISTRKVMHLAPILKFRGFGTRKWPIQFCTKKRQRAACARNKKLLNYIQLAEKWGFSSLAGGRLRVQRLKVTFLSPCTNL